MITILLAWINAKYDHDYHFLFIATFFIDLEIVSRLL